MFLFLAFSCTNGSDSENALAESTAPVAPIAEDPKLFAAREFKRKLETNMRRVVAAAENWDIQLGQQARQHSNAMRTNFAPAVIKGFTAKGATYSSQDTCTDSPCYAFVLHTFERGKGFSVGMWALPSEDMVFNTMLDPADDYASFVAFHELDHAFDSVESHTKEEVAVSEVKALNYEVKLVDAWTKGEFSKLVASVVDRISKNTIEFMVDGTGIVPAIPSELGDMFPNLSYASMTGLITVYLYEVNRQLLLKQPMSDSDRDFKLGVMYLDGSRNPAARNELLMRSLMQWKNPPAMQ